LRVLVVGSGGREHAIAWSLKKSPAVSKIWCAPGNAGMRGIAECVEIEPTQVKDLCRFAVRSGIDLTVVGPEAPLVAGIVDEFRSQDLLIFGPNQAASALEGSKCFAKDLMASHNIPTASHESFSSFDAAREFLRHGAASEWPNGVVVKADGLAAGKGAFVCDNASEAEIIAEKLMIEGSRGAAGRRVVIEERLKGEEISVLAICCGTTAVPVGIARDHKRLLEWDRGPNTGGMGAYSPVPGFGEEDLALVLDTVIRPTLKAMVSEGRPFSGVLYAGLMLTDKGPAVLEYNVRFGDPETQAILPVLKDDLFPFLVASASDNEQGLGEMGPILKDEAAVCVVMAMEGYPGSYDKGKPISGLQKAESLEGVTVFHSGTDVSPGGQVITRGGRVLGVVGTGDTLEAARERAYEGVSFISFDGAVYRRDIGLRLP
jgi:phosphoribosylamine--glycine ligase